MAAPIDMDVYIQKVVSVAPPLTPAQRDRLFVLLQPPKPIEPTTFDYPLDDLREAMA